MKYLALDIGNVLCHLRQDIFVNGLSSKMNISIAESTRFLKRFWEFHDLGFTRIEDELIDKLGVKSEIILKELSSMWDDVISPNYRVIDFINQLREDHGVKVALLSNMGFEHAESMKTKLSRDGLFEDSVKHLSCFVGARKPSKLYYQSFLWENPEFKGCVYVDDLTENLKAGTQFGFVPFYFSLEDKMYQDKLALMQELVLA